MACGPLVSLDAEFPAWSQSVLYFRLNTLIRAKRICTVEREGALAIAGRREIDISARNVLRLPILDGAMLRRVHSVDRLIKARIVWRAHLEDVSEYRPAHARSSDAAGFLFYERNRLIGRLSPCRETMGEITELPETPGERSMLSAGGPTQEVAQVPAPYHDRAPSATTGAVVVHTESRLSVDTTGTLMSLTPTAARR